MPSESSPDLGAGAARRTPFTSPDAHREGALDGEAVDALAERLGIVSVSSAGLFRQHLGARRSLCSDAPGPLSPKQLIVETLCP